MNDVFGQGVLNYYNGIEEIEYVERDDGFISTSCGIPLYFSEYKDWRVLEKEAIKYAKGRVLDVGAGAGRVSLYLQEKGMDVIAIDNSPLAIKVCEDRGVKDARLLPFEDVGEFESDSLDTIVMFGCNFSLFGSPSKAKRILNELYRVTSDNARIIAQINDTNTDNPIHLNYQEKNRQNGKMVGEIRMRLKIGDLVGDWFNYLIVSKEEIGCILEDTGWVVKKFIESNTSSYVAIIEKK